MALKVLGISGTLRKDGNSEFLVRYCLEKLAERGIDTNFISLRGKTIKPCRGCYECKDKKRCNQKGDDYDPIYDAMREADGIIVGSPVYFSSVAPQLMALLDRAGFSSRFSGEFFSGKVGAPITVARRTGQNLAFAQLLMWYFINDMIIPGSTYWTMGVAGSGGARDAGEDSEGLQIIDHFADNMVKVMKALH